MPFAVDLQLIANIADTEIEPGQMMETLRESAAKPTGIWWAIVTRPALWLIVVVATLAYFASQSLNLPIGPMYWDTFVYFDAVQRIDVGQVPMVDFSAPVGPLGYEAIWIMTKLFPDGQPLLLAQWSMLLVTAPLMLIAARQL